MPIKILINATLEQKEQWLKKPTSKEVELLFFNDGIKDADLYIDCMYSNIGSVFNLINNKPVLINAVAEDVIKLPRNFFVFNGWITSISNSIIECNYYFDDFLPQLKNFCEAAGWQLHLFKDVIGVASARSIAMIINEAYFALEANVSSKEDIDVAMKLGTNYPYGPFEWAKKIGLKEIYNLLKTLSSIDSMYEPCLLLQQEDTQ